MNANGDFSMKLKKMIIIALEIWIIASCSNQNLGTATSTPFHKPISEKSTPNLNENPTLLPVMPDVSESQMFVNKLLEDNAGCQLPCWWGITPGETTWDDARQILGEVSSYVSQTVVDEISYTAFAHVYPPYPNDPERYMETIYRIDGGVVRYIRIYNDDLTSSYYLSKFLENHGEPTEIWIRTFSEADMELQPFLIDLFYQDKSMLLEYGTGMPLEEDEGKIKNCHMNDMDSPFIHLWSLSENLPFQEAKKFLDTENLPEPKPLFDATGMDVKTFYEAFKNSDATVCLGTPKDLWP